MRKGREKDEENLKTEKIRQKEWSGNKRMKTQHFL